MTGHSGTKKTWKRRMGGTGGGGGGLWGRTVKVTGRKLDHEKPPGSSGMPPKGFRQRSDMRGWSDWNLM